MWRSWFKSAARIHNASTIHFSCSTFKDIQTLCTADDENSDPQTSTKPPVFHRVRLPSVRHRLTRQTPPEPEPKPNGDSTETSSPPETEPVPEPNVDSTETPGTSELSISIPGAEKRIVVYFTSLRVVRSTFEDCRTVQSILRGFRVSLDERDLSMDSCFLEELQGILGQSKLTVPRVFIGGRYIGGAEEVRQLHEIGELKKYVEGLPAAEPGVCDVCGGYRFILCDNCNGSHKLYFEKGGFRSCADCNENGLIRCPSCSCAPP